MHRRKSLLVLLLGAMLAATSPSFAGGSAKEEIASLKELLALQQKQIEQLRAALEEQKQLLERAVQNLAPAAPEARIQRASVTTATAPAAWPAAEPSRALVQASAPAAEDSAGRVRFKNVWLSPGGFVEAVALYRSHNQNADLGSTYGGIALDGTANSRLSEFRASARQSRLSLLAETEVHGVKASGYFEGDFLGAAPTANEVESNSFQPRLRQFWGQVNLPRGVSVAVGQMWSLLTTNRKGLQPRAEFIPATIDAQYVVGYNWARQFGARVTGKFGQKVFGALSVENPETAVGGVVLPAGVQGFNGSSNAQSPSSQFTTSVTPGATGVSTDLAPDLLGKLAFEPGWGHWELKAVGRFFRSRLNGTNESTFRGGIGAAGLMPLHKKLDLLVEGLAGSGIGRYAAAVGPDVAVKPDGTLVPIQGAQFLAGLEWHPTPAWDVNAYYGLEYYDRTAFPGTAVGYGSPLANLSGCGTEVPGTCQGANKNVWQIQPGIWYRFYRGKEGTLALGLSYSFTQRRLWSGLGGARPAGRENIVMTAVRYYLP